MDAISFFKADALQLPLRRTEADRDFEAYLDRVFARFLAEFEELSTADPPLKHLTAAIADGKPQALRLCNGVKEAVHEYLHGFPHEAFNQISEAIKGVRKYFDYLCPLHNQADKQHLEALYRIRAEKPHEEPRGMWFSRGDIFHIPFEKRHLVTRQRYSISGLPCLYLGSTLWVCWEELGRPSFIRCMPRD